MIYGYARVSTNGQAKDGNSLEYQKKELIEAGATEIFVDAFTGKTTKRPEFEKLLSSIQPGDTMVVTKIDRFARTVSEGSNLVEKLMKQGITVNILNMGRIDDSVTGKLIFNIMLAFAEFEREMIIQRTQEGKQIARQNPDFQEGRPKKYTKKQIEHALELLETKSIREVVEMTGISKSTLLRAKKSQI